MVVVLGLLVVAVFGGAVLFFATSRAPAPSPTREDVARPAPRSAAPMAVPPEWGWAKLNDRGERSVGYYYRDRAAGPSFHVLFEDAAPRSAEELRRMRYRGSLTKRLGAHETLQIPEGMTDGGALASMLTRRFESGGASGCTVLKLSSAEREPLGLPDAPPWIDVYLR